MSISGKIIGYDAMHRPLCRPVQLLAASCGMAVVLLSIMRSLHVGLDALWSCQPDMRLGKERWGLAWRIGCGVFHFTVPLYGLLHPIENASIHFVYLFLMLALEVRLGGNEEEHSDTASQAGTIASSHSRASKKKETVHGKGHGPRGFVPPQSAAAIQRGTTLTIQPRRSSSSQHPLDSRHSVSIGRRSSESQRKSIDLGSVHGSVNPIVHRL